MIPYFVHICNYSRTYTFLPQDSTTAHTTKKMSMYYLQNVFSDRI